MKRAPFLLLFVLLQAIMPNGYGQSETIVDQSGKVIALAVSGTSIKDIRLSALCSYNEELKKGYREQTAKLVRTALKNLDAGRNNLRAFYTWLWGVNEVTRIENELNDLADYLTRIQAIPTLSILSNIKTPIEKNLINGETFSRRIKTDQHVQLWMKDLYRQFLFDYYNSCISSASDNIKEYDLEKLRNHSLYLQEKYANVTTILKRVYQQKDIVTIDVLDALEAFGSQFMDPTMTDIKNLLNDKWFKQWVWFNGGKLKLNPLDFTTEAFLKKYPTTDLRKAGIYEEYLDSLAVRYIRYDSTEHIESFRKILLEMGKGEDRFAVSARAEAGQENKKRMEIFLKMNKLLNDIKIPEPEKANEPVVFFSYSFSPNDEFAASNNKAGYLTAPVRTGEAKIIAVHNIPSGYSIDMKANTTAIKDRSEVQTGIDSIISFAAQLSALAANFSPYAGYLAAAQKTSVLQIGPITSSAPSHFRPTPVPPVLDILKEKLEKENRFRQDIFNSAKDSFANLSPYLASYDPNNSQQQADIRAFLEKYFEEYKNRLEAAVTEARADSLYLSHLTNVFAYSTLPPLEMKPTRDETPAFYSKLLKTKASDEPVKNEISLIGFKGQEDTSDIANFTYRVGRNYRFQLSAGIAYTFSKFVQTSAKEENGEIDISNHANQYQFLVGVHVHFGKGLFLQDNRFAGNFWERSAAFLGVGVPRPLDNVYFGYSYDLFPGLKTTLGAQFVRYNKYTIRNNTILEERKRYQVTGPFVAVQIDPTGLLNALNVLFKN